MNTLKLDTNVGTNADSSPSTTCSNSSSPSTQSESMRRSLSRQSSQTDTFATIGTASTSSLATPTVKFAPLPTLGPRKRRSNLPLGMAARAQLMRKRRGGRQSEDGDLLISSSHRTSSVWTRVEMEAQRMRIEAMAAKHAEYQARENAREVKRHCDEAGDDNNDEEDNHGDDDEDDDEVAERRRRESSEDGIEDLILVFGKTVKVGKTLWKRMARSSKESEARPYRGQERRRELSPMPILIKAVPPEPVPSARLSYVGGWDESPVDDNMTEDEPESGEDDQVPRAITI